MACVANIESPGEPSLTNKERADLASQSQGKSSSCVLCTAQLRRFIQNSFIKKMAWIVRARLAAGSRVPLEDVMCCNYIVAFCDDRWEPSVFRDFHGSEDYSNMARNDDEARHLDIIYHVVKTCRQW